MNNIYCLAAQSRATIHAGADNTKGKAVATPTVSGVFSRPEFAGLTIQASADFGRDGQKGDLRRTALPVLSTSRPPVDLDKLASGFQSRKGAIHMANTATTTPKKGISGNHAHIPHDHATYALNRQIPDIQGRGCIIGTTYGELTIPPGRLAEKLAQFLARELSKMGGQ